MVIWSLQRGFLLHTNSLPSSLSWKRVHKEVVCSCGWSCCLSIKQTPHCTYWRCAFFQRFCTWNVWDTLKGLFLYSCRKPALQPALVAMSVGETASWTRAMQENDPDFQDHALTEQLQELTSALLLCGCPRTCHEKNLQNSHNLHSHA